MNELQYKDKSEFYDLHKQIGSYNLAEYYKFFDGEDYSGKKVLDVGCGQGDDIAYFQGKGAIGFGIDINEQAVKEARERMGIDKTRIVAGKADSMDFESETFDAVASNYVIQAIADIQPVYKEINRVLKKGGTFTFLATHPMRQYFERKDPGADYFLQGIVDSVILNNTVTVQEPTHTMNDYFSDYFLENFTVERFVELHDPTAEKIDGRTYPGFLIVKCAKE